MRVWIWIAAVLLGCNSKPQPNVEQPPFDPGAASAALTRVLQAQERGDQAGISAELFPRNPQTLAACAKTRLALGRSVVKVGVGGEESSGVAPHVTGVQLGTATPTGNGYSVEFTAIGNDAFSGVEQFVHANGRWWVKCQM